MKIVADENITAVAQLFAPYGKVITVPGRAISNAMLQDADILLVRSITRVDATLLRGTRCRFVGTATSGIDHIDVAALRDAGIALGWAKGCNSMAVVDYVFSALAHLAQRGEGWLRTNDWRQCSVGIVGCGQIGGALAARLDRLGIPFRIHDPFLDSGHRYGDRLVMLEDVLQQDIITLHVPLTIEGPAPTFHMLNERTLARIGRNSVLINAARGSVIDNGAMLDWLGQRVTQQVVLDTWENEPSINLALLQKVRLGTPHIAGYSHEGKLRGTTMLLDQFRAHCGFSASVDASGSSGPVLLTPVAGKDSEQLDQLILAAYDVNKDHRAMLGLLDSAVPGQAFDGLRKHYPVRHEFSHFGVKRSALNAGLESPVQALGFQLID